MHDLGQMWIFVCSQASHGSCLLYVSARFVARCTYFSRKAAASFAWPDYREYIHNFSLLHLLVNVFFAKSAQVDAHCWRRRPTRNNCFRVCLIGAGMQAGSWRRLHCKFDIRQGYRFSRRRKEFAVDTRGQWKHHYSWSRRFVSQWYRGSRDLDLPR